MDKVSDRPKLKPVKRVRNKSSVEATISTLFNENERTSQKRKTNSEDHCGKKAAATATTSQQSTASPKFRIPKLQKPIEHSEEPSQSQPSRSKSMEHFGNVSISKQNDSGNTLANPRDKIGKRELEKGVIRISEETNITNKNNAVKDESFSSNKKHGTTKSKNNLSVGSSTKLDATMPIVLPETSFLPISEGCTSIDEAVDMDWENQVPEIRRLWKENSLAEESASNIDDDMEIDPTDILIIVPDTNIWIGCVDLLSQILETNFPKVGLPTIVIPWMVLQELDVNIKAPNSRSARSSVKFIHTLLSSKHPRVKGQKASDAALSHMKFDEITADDSILQCVIQLQKSDSTTIFLTNDRNLCNKALVHGLLAFSSSNAISSIIDILSGEKTTEITSKFPTATKSDQRLDWNWNVSNNLGKRGRSPNTTEFNDQLVSKLDPPPAKLRVFARVDSAKNESNNVESFKKILDLLQKSISFIIQSQMEEDYGKLWLHTVKIKPPWTLSTGVNCMVQHWLAVFSLLFGSKGKYYAEQLLNAIRNCGDHGSAKQQEDVIESALALFNMGKGKLMKEPLVMECRQTLLVPIFYVSSRVSRHTEFCIGRKFASNLKKMETNLSYFDDNSTNTFEAVLLASTE